MKQEIGVLRIYCYRSTKNGSKYKMARYKGEFHFVHISPSQLSNCVKGMNRFNKEYYEYSGDFILNEDNTIDIK